VTRAAWWKAGGLAIFALACAIVFAAYLRPDMLAVFGEVMAFCASILK
jgi:hypothetical protein